MKLLNVTLHTMCADKVGIYLLARTDDRVTLPKRPMARYKSLSALQGACESVGVPCSEWGGPDPRVALQLSTEQLSNLGFKVNETPPDDRRLPPDQPPS